jgi:transcriptional regulator with XRE-family HTH domain
MLVKGELSEGARLLRSKGRQSEIARRTGVTQATVSFWMNAKYSPDHAARMVLQRVYGIPMDAWDRAPDRRAS